MPYPYHHFGLCRDVQDHFRATWAELEQMKATSQPADRAEFEQSCGPLDEDEEVYTADPSFEFRASTLQGQPVLYWSYAGFENIYMLTEY